MDIQAAKQVAREAAEDVIPRIGKADLLPRSEQVCGECEGTMTRHMPGCRWPE
jgi:hypothetical protein